MSSQSFWRLISMRPGPSDSPKQTSLVELLPCWTVEAWQSHRKQRSMDLEGGRRGVSVHFFFFLFNGCRGVQQQQQWGLQWEKYQQHYGVGLSLPSLSMRGRGLSEHTKGKKTQSQTKSNGRDGWKERGGERERERETTHEELREGQREGLKSIQIRNGGDSRRSYREHWWETQINHHKHAGKLKEIEERQRGRQRKRDKEQARVSEKKKGTGQKEIN